MKKRWHDEMLRYAILLLVLVGLAGCGRSPVSDPFTPAQRARAAAAFDPAALVTAADHLRQWHQAHQTGAAETLQPGLAAEELPPDLLCQPPAELLALWGWRNGQTDGRAPLLWYHQLLSLEQALAERQALIDDPLLAWPEQWLPVLVFEGEWYFVECQAAATAASPVGYFFLEEPEPVIAYTNLTRLLVTQAAWLEQGALGWDPARGTLTEELPRLAAIHRQHNPGARFPYHVD